VAAGTFGEHGEGLWDAFVKTRDRPEARKAARERFEEEVLHADIAAFRNAPIGSKTCFFDCGVVEATAYLEVQGSEVPKEFLDALEECRYDRVFFAPFWPELMKNTADAGITEWRRNFSDALYGIYERLGYDIVTIPKASVEERVKFIMGRL
jgi:predicted ATPase